MRFLGQLMRKIRNFYSCVTSIMKSLGRLSQIPSYRLGGICTISNASQRKTGTWCSGWSNMTLLLLLNIQQWTTGLSRSISRNPACCISGTIEVCRIIMPPGSVLQMGRRSPIRFRWSWRRIIQWTAFLRNACWHCCHTVSCGMSICWNQIARTQKSLNGCWMIIAWFAGNFSRCRNTRTHRDCMWISSGWSTNWQIMWSRMAIRQKKGLVRLWADRFWN